MKENNEIPELNKSLNDLSELERARFRGLSLYFLNLSISLLDVYNQLNQKEAEHKIEKNQNTYIEEDCRLDQVLTILGVIAAEVSINLSKKISEGFTLEQEHLSQTLKNLNNPFGDQN